MFAHIRNYFKPACPSSAGATFFLLGGGGCNIPLGHIEQGHRNRGEGGHAPPPLTRMKILKNRRNSSKLPRKLHGLKHINKTFKIHPIAPFKDKIINICTAGGDTPPTPSPVSAQKLYASITQAITDPLILISKS